MNYDKIIIELLSRVKILEEEVIELKEKLEKPEVSTEKVKEYTKTSPEMIMSCYKFGKKAFENPNTDIKNCAEIISKETQMNKSSAFMYIYVVKCLLSGEVFKRAINSSALKTYLNLINEEFGKNGLKKALYATHLHIQYRKSCGQKVTSISKICTTFEKRL